jgi:rhizosphere induced protein
MNTVKTSNRLSILVSLISVGIAMCFFLGCASWSKCHDVNQLSKPVPVGTILPYAGYPTSVPSGWMLCKGQALDNKQYGELFKVINYIWGKKGTQFKLPDLRGMFLRGVNYTRDDKFKDPKASERNPNNLTEINEVGSFQSNQVGMHEHATLFSTGIHDKPNPIISGQGGNAEGHENIHQPTSTWNGSESRPNNAYVNYIIKVK